MDIESFLGLVKWHRADRQVPFGAQKTQDFQGPYCGGGGAGAERNLITLLGPTRCGKDLNCYARAASPHYKTY